MFTLKSVKGSLSFSVVLPSDLKPVFDKNTRSSPMACTVSLATRPTPLITSLSASDPTVSGLSYITMLFLPNITNLP